MGMDIEVITGAVLPGGGPTTKSGLVIPVPFRGATVSQNLATFACSLMGYSVCESTGQAGAVGELVGGGDDNGELIANLVITTATDPSATQNLQDSTQSGANVALAATINGIPTLGTFIQSLRIEGLGATAATEVQATLTGVQGGTITYPVSVPAGVLTPIVPVTDSWPGRGLPASALGGSITLNLPAFGAGNTFAEIDIQGYTMAGVGVDRTIWFGPDGIYARAGIRLRVIFGSLSGAVYIRS